MKKILTCVVIACLAAVMFEECNAEEMKDSLSFAGEYNGLYRYEFPNGVGFNSSMRDGEKDVALAFFSFDNRLGWEMTRDDNKFTYSNGSVIEIDGKYNLKISVDNNNEKYTDNFTFSVKADEDAIEQELKKENGELQIDLTPFLEGNINKDIENDDLSGFDFGSLGVDESSLNVENFDPSAYVENFDMTSFVEEQFKNIKNDSGTKETFCEGYYNSAVDRFIYKFPAGVSFSSSVPNGCITQESVGLNFSDNMLCEVYKNREKMDYKSGDSIEEPGNYLVTVYSGENADASDYYFNFSFKIIGEKVNDIEFVNTPLDFSINSVSFDGQNVAYDSSFCRVDKDGDYIISFKNNLYPTKKYTLSFTKDTASPWLSLENKGFFLSKVSYLPSEESADVEVFHNGEAIENVGKISKAGHYVLRISDEAGNYQNYYITLSHPVVSLLVFLVILLVILLGIWYLKTGAAKVNE